MDARLRAVADLTIPNVREHVGRHEYDGVIQDLSPAGVAAGLARLGAGDPPADPYDAALLRVAETGLRTELGLLEVHRWNPLVHVDNLDLSAYERAYAPESDRAEARARHLRSWPDAVDAALAALDRVPRDVADALLPAATGLVADLPDDGDADLVAARRAHERLIEHLRAAAAGGPEGSAIGGDGLARLMGDAEGTAVDLDRLAATADAERDRLHALLREGCERLRPGAGADAASTRALLHELLADHPDADGIQEEARAQIREAEDFARARDLLPALDGECLVGPAPPARRWAMAMMSWAAPYEPDAPSWYWITPPDPSWPPDEQEEWLQVFSRTTLPAITVHEVVPGHFSHGRHLRSVRSDVRRTCLSLSFVEGWAHHVEELYVEEGFRADDPRFAIGVAVEALVRVARLACAIGVHRGEMTVTDAARRFEEDGFLGGPAAMSEARRASFDPTYGRYTWGKLEIRRLRDEARARWGARYSNRRFHTAMLDLGAPPLGLLDHALAE